MTFPRLTLPPKTVLGYRKNGQPIYNIAGGSENAPEQVVGEQQVEQNSGDADQGQQNAGTEGNGGNPAWKEFLDVLPTSLHSTVTPVLKKWDESVQNRFQQVHSEYEPLKPWQQIQQAGYDVDTVAYALQVLNALNENPRQIYDAMQQNFGWGSPEQGQQPEPQTSGTDGYNPEDYVDPRMQELQTQVETMAQILLGQHESELNSAADDQVEQDLQAARDQFGLQPQHEQFVLSYALAQNTDILTAAQAWNNYMQQERQQQVPRPSQNAPIVMGGGGGLPSQQIPVSSLSDKDRRSLVATILQRAAEQNG